MINKQQRLEAGVGEGDNPEQILTLQDRQENFFLIENELEMDYKYCLYFNVSVGSWEKV